MKKTVVILVLLLIAMTVWAETYITSVLEFDLSAVKAIDIEKSLNDYTRNGYSIVSSFVHNGVLFVILQARVR
jgi:hypothetical protein